MSINRYPTANTNQRLWAYTILGEIAIRNSNDLANSEWTDLIQVREAKDWSVLPEPRRSALRAKYEGLVNQWSRDSEDVVEKWRQKIAAQITSTRPSQ